MWEIGPKMIKNVTGVTSRRAAVWNDPVIQYHVLSIVL
jgi:hypothetical protein